jgi:hypothetical protein
MLDESVNYYIQSYNWYKDGYLLEEGTWIFQNNKFIEAMDILKDENLKFEQAKIKEIQKNGSN